MEINLLGQLLIGSTDLSHCVSESSPDQKKKRKGKKSLHITRENAVFIFIYFFLEQVTLRCLHHEGRSWVVFSLVLPSLTYDWKCSCNKKKQQKNNHFRLSI